MAYKIKLSLHGAKPVVNRTIALSQDMELYDAALVFITAIGWRGGRDHYFVTDLGMVEEERIRRDMEEFYTVEDLKDMNATFYYDRYTDWRVDIDFKGETDENGPSVLSYKGECPNQLLSGIRDFNRIRKAADDPSDPYHDQAEAWLSTMPPYDIDEVNEHLGNGETAFPEYHYVTNGQLDNPLIAFMNVARKMMDGPRIRTKEFRCPECGSVCDGRMNLDLPPSRIKNMDEYPATIVCPRCRTETTLSVQNDGFRIGYHEKISSRPQDQQTEIYDMLSRKDEARDTFKEARYQAELGMLFHRYDYRRDNTDVIETCLNALDRNGPEYENTSALCRESIVMQAVKNGKRIPEDTEGFYGTRGAIALTCMHIAKGVSEEEMASIIPEAKGMVDSESDPEMVDRCEAAALIAEAAHLVGDTSTLVWAAEILEEAAAEAEEYADVLESVEWRNLCYLMECVVGGMYSADMPKEADKALKCMTSPFVDYPEVKVPPAVRNIIAFRRAMLFLSTDGDEEQALEDLESIMKSIRDTEDNGVFTMRRMPYVEMLLAQHGRVKKKDLPKERAAVAGILVELFSAKRATPDEMNHAIQDFMCTYLGKGYSYKDACEDFRKHGMRIIDKMPEFGEFNIDWAWDNDLTWTV